MICIVIIAVAYYVDLRFIHYLKYNYLDELSLILFGSMDLFTNYSHITSTKITSAKYVVHHAVECVCHRANLLKFGQNDVGRIHFRAKQQ